MLNMKVFYKTILQPITLFLIFFVFLATLNSKSALAERRVALVVGNASYDRINSLRNPVRDARAVAETLKKIGFSESEIILKTNLSKNQFDVAKRDFFDKLRGAEFGFFYYSGHGFQANGENYLLHSSARMLPRTLTEDDSQSITQFSKAISSIVKTHAIVMDACRNIPALQKLIDDESEKNVSEQTLGYGLADFTNRSNALMVASTQPGQFSFEGQGETSIFTKHLVKNMDLPNTSLETVLQRTSKLVQKETSQDQKPNWVSSLDAPIKLFKPRHVEQHWTAIKHRLTIPLVRHFLVEHPDSRYEQEANKKLQNLLQQQNQKPCTGRDCPQITKDTSHRSIKLAERFSWYLT
ncbi:MAG: caspase family protein [Boseongicola sp.]